MQHESFRKHWTPELRALGRKVVDTIQKDYEPFIRSVYAAAIETMKPEDLPAELVAAETRKMRYILTGDFDTGYADLQTELIKGIVATGIDWQTYMMGYAHYQAGISAMAFKSRPDARGHLRPPDFDLEKAALLIQLATTGDAVVTLQYFFDEMERKAEREREALLSTLFSSIGEDTQALSFSATELRSTFDTLSNQTETQAAALEQNSAALSELETQVSATARDARDAAQKTQRADLSARSARDEVNITREAVRDVVTRTEEIRRFVDMVDQIALQTKLLALNASVEAARAGDHGRGFSVVATEVRALADQSAKSAAEVAAVVKAILESIQGINNRSDDLTTRLTELVQEIAGASEGVGRIDAAAQEQSDAIAQVASNQRSLDQSNQVNAAAVGEANGRVRQFEGTVAQINLKISDFRTDTAGDTPSRSFARSA
jgi:methyl-accepting chemotaxis protein